MGNNIEPNYKNRKNIKMIFYNIVDREMKDKPCPFIRKCLGYVEDDVMISKKCREDYLCCEKYHWYIEGGDEDVSI